MARVRYKRVIMQSDGDVLSGATVKVWTANTGSVSGATTTGTPISTSIYAAVSGGSPISSTLTTNSRGEVDFYADFKDAARVDLGVDALGSDPARVFSYEAPEFDAVDLVRSRRVDLVNEYGITANDTSAAATNTAALNQAATDYLDANAGARFKLRGTTGGYYFNNGVIINPAAVASRTPGFELEGDGEEATRLWFPQANGTSSITVGGNGYDNGEVRFPTFRKLQIRQFDATGAALPNSLGPSGWALDFKDGARYPVLDRVWVYQARKGVKFGEDNAAKEFLGGNVVNSQIDVAPLTWWNGAAPIAVQLHAGGGFAMNKVELNGNGDGTLPTWNGTSIGFKFAPPAASLWDTADFHNVLVKDHGTGVDLSTTGRMTTVTWVGCRFDGIADTCVNLVAGAANAIHTWTFDASWFVAELFGIKADGSAGAGYLYKLKLGLNHFVTRIARSALLATRVTGLTAFGNEFGGGAATYHSVQLDNCQNFGFENNDFSGYQGGAASGFCLQILASCDYFSVGSVNRYNVASKTGGAVNNAAGASAGRRIVETGVSY